MNKRLSNLVSLSLMYSGIAWFIYTILSSYGTVCFNYVNAYFTITLLLLDSIWNNFVR